MNTEVFHHNKQEKEKWEKWAYNFMACEIESPLTEFYLLVDNEELPHLRQAWVVKASEKQGLSLPD